MTSPSATDRQTELETRAVQLSSVDLKACKDLRAAFGSADQWQLQVGPYRFVLIPFLREWWWYDNAHKEWRYTGHGPGEVRFVSDGNNLRLEKVTASPNPELASAAPPSAAPKTAVRRFCPSCGAPAEPAWRFCQACGSALPQSGPA